MDKKLHRAGRANKASSTRGTSQRSRKPQKGHAPRRSKRRSESKRMEPSRMAVIKHLHNYALACLCDVRDLQPGYGYADFIRDVETMSRRLAAEGIQFATVTLPSFFDSLIERLETGKSDFIGFKKLHGATHPHFLRGLVEPILADPCSSLAVKNVELVYQFCVAFKKLEGTADKSRLRDQLADFVQTDIDLSNVDISAEPVRDIARSARKLIGKVVQGLSPLDPDQALDFVPRPGPGATNTPTEKACRYRQQVKFAQISDVFDPEQWFKPPFTPMSKHRRMWGTLTGVTRVGQRKSKKPKNNTSVSPTPPTSRFKFVPKTYTKMRGICIEENEVQWHQQAIRRGLYKRIESHPITKGRVNFTTQLVNGDLALKGSLDRGWVTIDMSSASDRISRSLVAYLFGENKSLLQAIEACSTEYVELPQDCGLPFIKVMPLKKIAPMGSAICFPIMSLVHFALIKAILDRSSVPQQDKREVYVFGDDIIVKNTCAQAVYDYLPLFGMKINTEKSFSASYFRESCGVHAYKGADVTPVRFKTLLDSSSDPASLATALRLEEALYYKGYSRMAGYTREMILKVARKYRVNTVPYVDTKSCLFGFFRRGNDARLLDFRKSFERRWIGNTESEIGDANKVSRPRYSQTWIYSDVAVIVDQFDDGRSFPDEEDRYLRWLVQHGPWTRKKFKDGYSRFTKIARMVMPESALGYRC